MRRFCLIAAVVGGILTHLVAQRNVAWASETVGNDPLGEKNVTATLISPRQDYFLGENIMIRYRLENTGKAPVRYEIGAFYPMLRRNDGYRISAVLLDDNGQPSTQSAPAIPGPENRGGRITHWELLPGQIHQHTLYLPRYFRFEKPGKYRIRIANVPPGGQAWRSDPPLGRWRALVWRAGGESGAPRRGRRRSLAAPAHQKGVD